MNYVDKFDSGLFRSLGASPGAGESFSIDIPGSSRNAPSDAVIVPDAHLLFSGDYKRSGLDLVLSKDGHEFAVPNYFRGENRATLASPDGANLSGKTVEALVGQVDYAQAGGRIAPDKVIGQVTKVSGSATAIRNGVSVTLNVGDSVHKNDVVQSGTDSSLGLTFVDGTVFGLSSNARMVLNEMVYNSAGSDNSSLLTLVQGTISFVAGATAKNGGMKVETPTATMGIRGTAVLVEIDFDIVQPGIAPPVSFRILVEPNGHIGEYVLLDKLTLQPIATVNQPGTKTVVNGQGLVTFVQSADIPSSAQRLINEIFTLKFTDANPKNIGIPPLDSITPDGFVLRLADGTPANLVPVQITFILQETPTGAPSSGGNTRFHLNIPPELVATSNRLSERLLTTGNSALDTISGRIHFDDINPEDRPTVSAQFNSFVYRNAEQAIVTSSLTLEQLAAISAVAVPLSVTPDANNTNIGDATWTYSVPDRALDFLAEGETLTLTYLARVDTNYAEYNTIVLRPFTITVTGKNDLATVAVTGSGIIELDGTNNPEIDHAEGIISFADVDLTDRPTVTAPFVNYAYTAANGSTLTLTPAQLAALAPSLTLTPTAGNTNNGSVAWSYDVVDASFDFIAAGETLVLNYIAIVDDHHGGVVSVPLTLTVTVRGTNDLPTITATSDGFIELVGTGNATPDHADGTITFADVDLTDRPTISAPFSGYTYKAANGTTALTLTPAQLNALAVALTLAPSPTNANNGAVTWSYDLADNQFDFLGLNETLVLTYTATVNDGHGGIVTTPITVTITGTNDVPNVAVADVTGAVTEAVYPASDLTDAGTIAFTDVDLTDTHSINQAIVASTGALGSLTASVTTDTTGSGLGGVVTWNYSVDASAVEYLAEGQTKVEQFTITLDDGNGGTITRTVEVTITGTNDAPVVATSDVTGVVTEAVTPAGNLTDTGTIAFTDVDLTDSHVINPTIVASTGALGTLTASVTTDTTGSGLGGVVTWSYSVPASTIEYLAEGQIKVEQFTITLDDGNGGTITRVIEVAITGTNDEPVVATSDVTGVVTEAVTPAGNLTDTGTIAFTDVDLTDTHVINPTIVASTGALGTLTASVTTDTTGSGLGGVVTWNYSVPALTIEYLAEGQTKVEQFTITLDDGNGGTITRTIEVTISGTNDAPVVATSDVTGAVTEAFAPTGDLADTGTIAFTDVDLADGHVITTIVPSSGALGSLTASVTTVTTGSGLGGVVTWNYSVPASTIEYLAEDQTKVEQFTITLDDGNGGTITRTVEVTITGTNDAPTVAAALTDAAYEGDTAFTRNLLDGATDADLGETATLSIENLKYTVDGGAASTGLPAGVTLGGDGHTLTVDPTDPAFDYLGSGDQVVIEFSYDIEDSHGATVAQTATVTITGTNDAPTILSATDAPVQTLIVLSTEPHILDQGVNTNSLGLDTETFDNRATGSFRSDALDATFSASGAAGVVLGSSSGVTAAPFVGPPPGQADQTRYLTIGAGGTETIVFDDPQNTFGLYWGSVDSYNTIAFYNGATQVASYTGADVNPLFATGNQGSFASNGYVEFSGLGDFNRVVLGTGSTNAFEIDNISAGSVHVELSAPISGTLAVADDDIGDTLTASVVGDAVVQYAGAHSMTSAETASLISASAVTFTSTQSTGGPAVLQWTYDPANPDLDFLLAGETLTITYAARINDGHGSVGNQPLTITLVGADGSADMSDFAVVNGTSHIDNFQNVGGNVTIFGGGGHDTFTFNAGFGHATIADFDINQETINIDHTLFASVAAILQGAQATNAGADTIITDAANDTILLQGVTLAQVQAHASSAFHLV